MENPSSANPNRTTGCQNPNRVVGDGGHNPLNPAGDRDKWRQQIFGGVQSLNAAADDSSGGDQPNTVCVDPITFANFGRRPMQTDFFREVALFNAHFGLEQERSQWAKFLPEYLRPGNLENYLKKTDKPQLFGNNFWWASQQSSEQELRSCSQGCDHIRYSRDQLLQLREVITVPEDILKIKQEIEAEFLSVDQITKHGETTGSLTQRDCKMIEEDRVANFKVDLSEALKNVDFQDKEKVDSGGVRRENESTLKDKKEEKKVANISVNANQEPETGENAKPEGGVSEKKKRGPISKERRAKKKIKERKKRAEKNRKLGVKRLKIQPILKPKTVSHCRHYLKGRCYEGEKCKFSHDIVPLTKSKPCCHFARQACMKGDDCPFDHELSNYPCNNYVSTGFCNRGESCLFSHEIRPNQDSVSAADIIKPEMKSSNPSPNHVSIQQIKNAFSSENTPTTKTGKATTGISTMNKPAQEPKGMSFLSYGSLPLDNSAKHKPANISQKPHFVFEAGAPEAESSSSKLLASSRTSKGAPALRAESSALPYKQHASSGMTLSSGIPALENPKDNVPTPKANQPVKTPKGLTFLNFRNPQPDDSTRDESRAPSVTTSNSNDVFVFGKSSLDNHGQKEKDASVVPFKLPASRSSSSPFFTRLDNAQVKSTSSSGQRALLSTLAFASKYDSGVSVTPNPLTGAPAFGTEVNKNRATGYASETERNESRMNVNVVVGTTTASSDVSKNGGTGSAIGAGQKKPASASEVWEMLYGGGSKSKQ